MAKSTTKAGTGLAKTTTDARKGELISVENYGIVYDQDSLSAFQDNLEGETISEFDLDQLKVPSGGGTAWSVPGLNGSTNQDSVIGVILSMSIRRGYWKGAEPDGSPPDCESSNGITGNGDPGGDCAACGHNQFNTSLKSDGSTGKGKRCRETRSVLFLREEDQLPIVVTVPPTSLKAMKRYIMKLPGVAMHQAVTTLSLAKVEGNPPYSVIVPTYVGHVSEEHGARLRSFAQLMKNTIRPVTPITVELTANSELQTGAQSEYGIDPQFVGEPNAGGD